VLVDAHLAGHEVVDLLRLQQRRVRTHVQLEETAKLIINYD
jgi:hypothetical protein